MSRFTRLLAVALLATASVVVTGPAAVAQPANDEIANATVIPTLPYTDTVNTQDAAIAEGDPIGCHSVATVWYTFTPTETTAIGVDTIGSTYDTTLSVYSGGPGDYELVACIDDFFGLQSGVAFTAFAGEQYLIGAGTCCGVAEVGVPGPGGDLVFNVYPESPGGFDVTVTLDPRQSVARDGTVTIRGTVTCTASAFFGIDLSVTQRLGRFQAIGQGSTSLSCGPEATQWSVPVNSQTGTIFGVGRAVATINFGSCSVFGCDSGSLTENLHLRRSAP